MRKRLFLFPLILLTVLVYACRSKPDLVKEEKAIRNLLLQERKAHFDKDVELFVSEFADSMTNVSKGNVTRTSIEANKQRIGKYFGNVKFSSWNDVAEPQVRFSADGSLAYAIVQKQVILSYPDSLGNTLVDTTDYAWVSIYRKLNGQWKVETNISTNK